MLFQEKDLMNIPEYADLLQVYNKDYNYDHENINQFGCPTSLYENPLFTVKIDQQNFTFLNGNEFSPILYRGQSKFYELCKPSLFRDTIPDLKETVSPLFREISEIQKLEFFDVITPLPMIQYMKQYEKRGYRFAINYEAIAQHYGFNTKHLDLTRSYDVAMFFATTKVIDDKYYVITEPQKGVIYTVNLKLAWQLDVKNITPIGFQPLNRPDQQYAFSVMLEENMNFNTLPFVEKKEFIITKELSEKYFTMFNGGDKLFPKDPISEIAYKIQSSFSLHRESISRYCQKKQFNKNDFISKLEQCNYGIRKTKFNLTKSEVELLKNKLYYEVSNLNKRVKARGISAHLELE